MNSKSLGPYRPSHGSEGESFQSQYCFHCRRNKGEEGCRILLFTMIYGINDPDYPEEWIRTEGGPVCLAFADKRIPAPEETDPRQQTLWGSDEPEQR